MNAQRQAPVSGRLRDGQSVAAAFNVRLMRLLSDLCLSLAALGAAAGGLLWLAQRPWFDIRAIDVRGDLRHVNAAALRAAVAGQLRGTFFTLRITEARRAFESVPWVAQASVRRIWPQRLEVTLIEHRAIGVRDDGRLVSDQGVLFAANSKEAEVYAPLVEFSGPEPLALEAVQRLADISQRLQPLRMTVTRIEVSERQSWAVETRDSEAQAQPDEVTNDLADASAQVSRFELGRDEPAGRIAERLTAVVGAYPAVVAQLHTAPTRIDLRYPNGFAAAAPGVPQALAAAAAANATAKSAALSAAAAHAASARRKP